MNVRITLFFDPAYMIITIIIILLLLLLCLRKPLCLHTEECAQNQNQESAITKINLCAGIYNKYVLLIHRKGNK